MVAATVELTPKAHRTRAAILQEAERLFAAHGFRGTRLEDVAQAVGIRRASIVYYFADKRELYDAVLADALGGLLQRLREVLLTPEPLRERVDSAVSVWVDYIGERPTLARLVLRESVDAEPGEAPALLAHIGPFVELVRGLVGSEAVARVPVAIGPAHIASAIAGATLFFVGAMPTFVPDLEFDPLSRDHLDAHRREVLRITARLLGDG